MSLPVPIHPPHLLITASAGSGKTWRLTQRLAALILAGEPPESLVALTFTRKAAGEFFSTLLALLARAAHDPSAAQQLHTRLGGGPNQPAAFLPHLRRLTAELHRLQFTTIDSFFHRILSAFPLDLGLSASFTLMDAFATQRARIQVLESLLGHQNLPTNPRSQFLENFKLATYGEEAKFATSEIADFIDRLYPLYLQIPNPAAWAGALFPFSPPAENPAEATALVQEIAQLLPDSNASDRVELWNEFASYFASWQPGLTPPKTLANTIRANILAAVNPSNLTCGTFKLNRKEIDPSPPLARALGRLAQIWANRALLLCLHRTHGTALILQAYHQLYDSQIRRTGRLVFDDLPRLIGTASSGRLTRLDIERRLDARFRHWLLDEFQDTSRAQWAVLENLIDEVLQDPENRRTFFCVGDRKQSIYAWRGGDHRLFDELRAKYSPRLATESIRLTQRCSPAIIDLVNRVMGQSDLPQLLGPGAQAWLDIWETHQSARTTPGFAAWIQAPEDDSEELSPRHRLIARLIQEFNPAARGWTCAVLVYSNKEAALLADALRATLPGLHIVPEGEIHPALDNSLGLGLLAWCRALTQPADTLAAGWLAASPAGSWLRNQSDWRAHAFDTIAHHGLTHAAQQWLNLLAPTPTPGTGDPFLELRRRQLLRAVRSFADTGPRDPALLEDFLRHHALPTPPAPGSIQVMTIHKAKGLSFDMVILTELSRKNHHINQRRDGPLIARRPDGSITWLCEPPSLEFLPFFPELAKSADQAQAENIYEQLCLLYVALTRARHALFLVSNATISQGTTVQPEHLIHRALTPLPTTTLLGNLTATTFGTTPPPPDPTPTSPHAPTKTPEPINFTPPPALDLRPRPPASPASTALPWADSAARDEGQRVHQILAHIPRATPATLQTLRQQFPQDPAARRALDAATHPDLRHIFHPEPEVTIWTERPFHCVLEDGTLAGVFDRVHLWPDSTGAWQKAEIFDFKTDHLTHETLPAWQDKHRPQLAAYRAALARLLDLDPAAIHCTLVSIPLLRAVRLHFPS